MNYYLSKLNLFRGEVKDHFRLAIKIEECFQFFVGS